MARLVSELGADVIDDTVVPSKVNKRKRNFIVGFSALGVGIISLGLVYYFAVTDWLSDYQNMAYITYGLNIEPDVDGPYKGQVTAYIRSIDNNSNYPSTFKIPAKINGHPITRIDDQAFLGCNRLKRVEMSNNITTIGDGAFLNCEKLESFKFSKNIEKIGNSAFDGTIYKENWKKNDVTYINSILVYVNEEKLLKDSGKNKLAFVASSDSEFVDVYKDDALVFDFSTLSPLGQNNSSVKVTKWMDGLFKDFSELIFVETPEYLSGVSSYAFQNCTNLEKAALNDTNTNIGEYAFDGCSNFSEVINLDVVKTIGKYAFQGTKISLTSLNEGVTSVGEGAFKGCQYITSMTIPSTITTIESRLFENTNLANVTFTEANNITTIGANAFRNTKLTNFRVPKEVKIINDNVFANCANLESVELYKSNITRIDSKAFYNSTKLHSIKRYDDNGAILASDTDDDTLYFPSSLVNTTNSSSGEEGSNFAKTSFKHVVIPTSVANIAASMFESCEKLEDVVYDDLSNSLMRTMGQKAFKGCTALTSFSFPNTVRQISSNAFNGCTSLVSVDLPERKNLTPVQIAALDTDTREYSSITNSMFAGCTALTTVTIPSTVSEIQTYAFRGCTALTRISIPKNVSTIKSNAFAECSNSLYISIEASSIPNRWSSDWNGKTNPAKYVTGSIGIEEEGDFLFSINSDGITATIVQYEGASNDLVIPETIGTDNYRVTGINDSFMADDKLVALTSISLPSSLTDVGPNAFKALLDLEDETISTKDDGIKYLGNSTNPYVVALAKDTKAENPTYKFDDNTRFIALALSNEIDSTNNTSNGNYLVSKTNEFFALKTVSQSMVANTDRITVNNQTKLIVSNAFNGFDKEIALIIPGNVECIADSAIKDKRNTTIYAESATRPNGWDFKWNVQDAQAYWGTFGPINNSTFKACENTDHTARLLKFLSPSERETIPTSINDGVKDYNVTGIGSEFLTGTTMTYLYIPSSVTKIEEGAFSSNDRLTIYCQASSEPAGYLSGWNKDDRPVYFGVNTETYEAKDDVDYVVVGDHVVVTGHNSNLKVVVIPETIKDLPVTEIGKNAFAHSENLVSIVIPESVTTIGENAFEGCSSAKIYCEVNAKPATFNDNWNPDDRPVYFSVKDETGLVTINGIEYLLRSDEANSKSAMITGIVSDINELIVGPTIEIGGIQYSVNKIGDSAFENAKISNIRLTGSNVSYIGKNAFRGSTLIGNVVLTSKVKFVGENAFEKTSTALKVFVEYPFSSEIYKSWDENWNKGLTNYYVGLDLVWEYDENRNPVVKQSETDSSESAE